MDKFLYFFIGNLKVIKYMFMSERRKNVHLQRVKEMCEYLTQIQFEEVHPNIKVLDLLIVKL